MDTSIITQRLGQQVRSMRLNRGYTQADLAKLAGVTRQKLIEIEKGSLSVSMNAYARVIAALGSEVKLVPVTLPTLEELEDLFNE
ncbi:helix-turn-helix domain-containing protein [Pseudomonas sp. WS 5532]|jgi:DNA-binding XRE family transcriptional regulator|uniref:Helix-turn-helix domain-containing protein n=3 Tax=Pseudomonas TaxID=286 RepID=A0A1H3SVC2_9PSED|nr:MULTISPECIES: helix-turn-helix domain-containing protein [Pseudomonas]MBD8090915.1 helix-turn-helix domain-containing protein [Pseudomonas fluorescens]MBD8719892.1 helix-turn-helix domain-containing protein [Pseudomonas fluorescens]MCF5144107.1 helix-turn-helix domain-containing protein [Pseudomonas sp. PA-6-3C]MCF5148408.1 helix-turn-helix domain-containing protein [Pseudomonas sp. PA-6-3F]MCF5158633.1 helix-turn-helix domain-containing protein [Pseudomonas sp. PA-6-2E]